MSLGDWAAWNAKKTQPRKREVEEYVLPVKSEPIEVHEDPLSETGVVRFLRRISGKNL